MGRKSAARSGWILVVLIALMMGDVVSKWERQPLAEHPYPRPPGRSPFAVGDISAGMSFSELDMRSVAPDSPPLRRRTMIGAFRDNRLTRMLSSTGRLVPLEVLVDSIEDRVVELRYGPTGIDDPALAAELAAAAAAWDKITGGVRESTPNDPPDRGTSSITWRTPDRVWSATIIYRTHDNSPTGLRLIEETGYNRLHRRHVSIWDKEHGREP